MQASARLSSSAAYRKVIAGVSSATIRSCYRASRGKAHAAPLPAQEPPRKGRKWIPKQERRVMTMEFIENYRASNNGKFPTITHICDQIGGSRYTVRYILQEMKYNDANLSLDDPKPAPLPVTEVTEHPVSKDAAIAVESQETLKVSEHPLNANDSNASDQNGSDMLNEAKMHAREDNPKLEESADTGLLGSLKSFAYGIRNFWKNM